MKKLIVLTVLAGLAVQLARKYNINTLEDLKNLILPKLDVLTAKG
jgi:hypothetical protein